MAVKDRDLKRLDESIDNLLIKIYSEKKLPEDPNILEHNEFIKELKDHTAYVSGESKKLSRQLSKSGKELDDIKSQVIAYIRTEFLNDTIIKKLQTSITIALEDQADSLGIQDDGLKEELRKFVFNGNDETTLDVLKKPENFRFMIQLVQRSEESKRSKKHSDDVSEEDLDIAELDLDAKDVKLYHEQNLVFLRGIFRPVIKQLDDKISSIKQIKNYLLLSDDAKKAIQNISSLESMMKNIKHPSVEEIYGELHFKIEKNKGLFEKLRQNIRKINVEPVTLILKVKITNHFAEVAEEKATGTKLAALRSIDSFDVQASIGSLDIPVSAKKINIEKVGALGSKVHNEIVESLIIPVLGSIVNRKLFGD